MAVPPPFNGNGNFCTFIMPPPRRVGHKALMTVVYPSVCSVPDPKSRMKGHIPNLTLMQSDPDYHQNLTASSAFPLNFVIIG